VVRSQLAVIIAAYNEEQGITPTLFELKEELNEPRLLVVDGKSSDKTLEFAKDLGAEVLLQKRKGKGDAISEGLSHIDKDTTYVIFIDADYTYPAKYLKEMINVLDEDPQVGMVLGDRFSENYKNESVKDQFYIGNKILGFVQRIINGVKLNDAFTGLRIIRYKLLIGWHPKSLDFDIEAELNSYINQLGYKIVEIPIIYRKRMGKKKLSFKHGFKILRRIIIESKFNIAYIF
jgi:glycosyltransferase involved in cell wall biosynthesis